MKKLIPYPTKTFTIIILLTLTLLLASINIISNRRIILSFTANANKDITYQVFWTRKDSQSFSEKQSIKQTIKQSDKKIKINIPTKKLARLRLDFGISPEKLTISHLKLKGKNRIIFNDFNKFQLKNINDSKIKEDVLFINSKHHDPYIIYKENISLKAKRYIDWHILIILSTIYFFISYKLVHYLAKFKIEKNNSSIDIIFIIIFFALLFIPMLHISDATKSEKENRMLATKPQLSNINRGGYNYGEKFEKYFNDRFFGRDTLIIIYDFITSVSSSKGNNRVLLGSNNWLFYKGENSIRNYQNLDIFTEEELKKAANYLQKIHNWSQKNNKDFYYIICPDKNKIYGEYYQFVEKINPDTKSRAEQLIRYLNKNTDVTVIYPYKSLLENKQTGLLYWKNDTHWNPLGAYIGYKELASKIAKKYNINIVKYNKLNRQQHPKGDLTNMFIIKKQDKFSNYLIPELKNNATCNKNAGEKKDAKCTNPNGKYRLSIFRDSFTTALAPYLNNTFKEVNYYWRHKIHSNDLTKLKNDTDIIILEQVERSIKHLPSFDFPEE